MFIPSLSHHVVSALWDGLEKITFEYGIYDVVVGDDVFLLVAAGEAGDDWPTAAAVLNGRVSLWPALGLLAGHPVADGSEKGGKVFQVVNARHCQLGLTAL